VDLAEDGAGSKGGAVQLYAQARSGDTICDVSSGGLEGSDYSWLACDARSRVGWFTINGGGPVPSALRHDRAFIETHEGALAAWVRGMGGRFEFGAGDSMWLDAASAGIFAFDWEPAADRYVLRERPPAPVSMVSLPPELRAVLTVRLATNFLSGAVSRDLIG
jgi:hypothetical protein